MSRQTLSIAPNKDITINAINIIYALCYLVNYIGCKLSQIIKLIVNQLKNTIQQQLQGKWLNIFAKVVE
jgi:hypothetical protein